MTAKSGSPPHSAQCACVQFASSGRCCSTSAQRDRNGRIASASTWPSAVSSPRSAAPASRRRRPTASWRSGALRYQLADRGQQLHVAAERLHLLVIRLFERAEAAQNVGGLPHHQPQIASGRAGCPRSEAAGAPPPGGAEASRVERSSIGSGTRPWMRRCSSSSSRCMSTASASSGCCVANRVQLQRFARLGSRRSWGGRAAESRHHAIIAGNADSDGRLRGAALCQNGRPGRRARRPAAGAGTPRARRRRRDAALPRHRCRATRSRRFASRSAARSTMREISTIESRRRAHVFVDHPAYFDREYLYGAAEHDYPDNPERFAFFCQAALDWAASTGQSLRRRPRARLAGRPGAGAPEACGCDTVRRAYAHRVHDSQPGVSGRLRRELAAASRSRLGSDARGRDGVLGPHQLSEGRHRLQPAHHDREPALRAGDPDAGARIRLRRHPAAPSGGPGRDPERNRLRSVGSGRAIRTCRSRTMRQSWRGRARPSGSCSKRYGLPAKAKDRGAAARRDDLPAGRSEGVRPARGAGGRVAAAGRDVRAARHRRAALRGSVARPGGDGTRRRSARGSGSTRGWRT